MRRFLTGCLGMTMLLATGAVGCEEKEPPPRPPPPPSVKVTFEPVDLGTTWIVSSSRRFEQSLRFEIPGEKDPRRYSSIEENYRARVTRLRDAEDSDRTRWGVEILDYEAAIADDPEDEKPKMRDYGLPGRRVVVSLDERGDTDVEDGPEIDERMVEVAGGAARWIGFRGLPNFLGSRRMMRGERIDPSPGVLGDFNWRAAGFDRAARVDDFDIELFRLAMESGREIALFDLGWELDAIATFREGGVRHTGTQSGQLKVRADDGRILAMRMEGSWQPLGGEQGPPVKGHVRSSFRVQIAPYTSADDEEKEER